MADTPKSDVTEKVAAAEKDAPVEGAEQKETEEEKAKKEAEKTAARGPGQRPRNRPEPGQNKSPQNEDPDDLAKGPLADAAKELQNPESKALMELLQKLLNMVIAIQEAQKDTVKGLFSRDGKSKKKSDKKKEAAKEDKKETEEEKTDAKKEAAADSGEDKPKDNPDDPKATEDATTADDSTGGSGEEQEAEEEVLQTGDTPESDNLESVDPNATEDTTTSGGSTDGSGEEQEAEEEVLQTGGAPESGNLESVDPNTQANTSNPVSTEMDGLNQTAGISSPGGDEDMGVKQLFGEEDGIELGSPPDSGNPEGQLSATMEATGDLPTPGAGDGAGSADLSEAADVTKSLGA